MKRHLEVLWRRLDHLRANDFVRHNAIMFVGSVIVAAVNYLYYPVVGRLVSTSQFGEVQALVSVSLQITLLLSVVSDVGVNIVANATDTPAGHQQRNRIVYELERLVTILMLIIVVGSILAIGPIKHFLHFNDGWPIAILGLSLVVNALGSQLSAFLRGVGAFSKISISGLVGAGVKLLSSLILVLIGFGTNGAIGGLVVAQLLTLLYLRRSTKQLGLQTPKNDSWLRLPDMQLIRPQLPYAALVLIVSIVTTVFFSIDVVLVKHYFSPELAGEYAGISTIARIIYFGTGSIATVLLSAVRLKLPMKENRKLFIKSMVLTVLAGGVALLAFAVAPRFFIHILIGKRYLPLAGLLPRLSLTMFVISVVNLVFSYDVALRRWSIAIVSVIGVTGAVLLVAMRHNSPLQLVDSLLLGACLLLLLRLIDSVWRNFIQTKFRQS